MKYTVCFLFTEDLKEVLLQKKDRTLYKGLLNGCGGKFEEFEDAYMCARREIKEETGFSIEELIWVGTLTLPECCDTDHPGVCKLFFMAAIAPGKEVHPAPGETEELVWVPVEDVINDPIVDSKLHLAGDGNIPYIVYSALNLLKSEQK